MNNRYELNKNLAQMLKGGVIMDVTTPEQAEIAEAAVPPAPSWRWNVSRQISGRPAACSRMSDPKMIKGIQQAVSIPVMAKCRIGHFAEAQVLEAIEIDCVDESEVLSPADDRYHIDKTAFRVPFVCGAKDLGEALRRIAEGASMIRTKGEPGTGDVVQAVRHMRKMTGEIARLAALREDELYDRRQGAGGTLRPGAVRPRASKAPGGQLRRRRRRHPGRRGPDDAAGGRRRVCRLRHLQVGQSGEAGRRHCPGRHQLHRSPNGIAALSEDLGEAMVGINEQEIALLMAERGQ